MSVILLLLWPDDLLCWYVNFFCSTKYVTLSLIFASVEVVVLDGQVSHLSMADQTICVFG